MEPVAPKLASQGLRNDGCETVSGHARIMLGSCSDHARNRPSIGIRVFTCFLKISWQVQHFVNLHVQISWQAQHFVNLHVQISWQVQHFVNLHVQISWQAQPFVHLHVQMSWQAQYKMRCGEIAKARNAVFFNGTGGSEAGKSRSAERRLRDGLGSCSDHARILLGSCSESSVHWD